MQQFSAIHVFDGYNSEFVKGPRQYYDNVIKSTIQEIQMVRRTSLIALIHPTPGPILSKCKLINTLKELKKDCFH